MKKTENNQRIAPEKIKTLAEIERRFRHVHFNPIAGAEDFVFGTPPEPTTTVAVAEPITLTRMAMPTPEPLDDVVKQAQNRLGYPYPKNQEIKERFLQACKEIDVMPFVPKAVAKYKISKIWQPIERDPLGMPFWRTSVTWVSTSLKKYSKPVPEFALQTALDIKAKMPECEFEVEELVAKPDPFLVAVLPDGSRWYLERWNEPGFKAVRME